MMRFYPLLRPLLFALPPERAHEMTLQALAWAGRVPPLLHLLARQFAAPAAPVRVAGLDFPSPLGLAAGYDKDGLALRGLSALGFGHVEVGTVTLRPQAGNPRPRVFRLPADRALINRMGFPSRGAAALARRLRDFRGRGKIRLGVNIGKNKDTPNEEAAQDYLALLKIFAPLADYLAVNISSPNTAGLRALQERAALEALLGALHAARQSLCADLGRGLPLFIKLSPDLNPSALEAALEAIVRSGMDGVILTNTTVQRPPLVSAAADERGGLSGAPLRSLSESALRQAVARLDGALPVISVGGVIRPEDVRRRLDMGAALVQVFTGLIYYGPSLPRDALRFLAT